MKTIKAPTLSELINRYEIYRVTTAQGLRYTVDGCGSNIFTGAQARKAWIEMQNARLKNTPHLSNHEYTI